MINEELLLKIEKLANQYGIKPNSLLIMFQDIAKAYNTSLEEWVNNMPSTLISVGQTKPIRIKETSCKNCKYYVEIPQKISLSDIFEEREPIRLCDIERLGEPILGDRWQSGCICFSPKKTKRRSDLWKLRR